MDKWKRCKVLHMQKNLYVISDNTTIQEGDWAIDPISNSYLLCTNNGNAVDWVEVNKLYEKIIASTDPSLNLPQPSQAFVEKYYKLDGIDEVIVKYEEIIFIDPPEGWKYGFPKQYNPDKDGQIYDFLIKNGYDVNTMDSYGNHFHVRHIIHEVLSVNKNQITIRKVKDYWSKEEVKAILHEFIRYIPKINENSETLVNNFLNSKI